jgi:hypothetical protein
MGAPLITFPVIAPGHMFQNPDGSLCPIKQKFLLLTASSTNTELVAAVTGKCIRMLSAIVVGDGAATFVRFKNGTSGAGLYLTIPANTTAEPNVVLDLNPMGWIETDAATALDIDCGDPRCRVSIKYIEFILPV